MSWEAIPKQHTGHRKFDFPAARIAGHGRKGKWQRLVFNAAAVAMLPESIVLVRNGSQFALRLPLPGDSPNVIRRLSKTSSQAACAFSGYLKTGDRFRLVQKDSLFLLEPFTVQSS